MQNQLINKTLLFFVTGHQKFAAICCNVGDSLAYVYTPKLGHVREITLASHDIQSNRDMRDALGKNKFQIRDGLAIKNVFKKVPLGQWMVSIQNLAT